MNKFRKSHNGFRTKITRLRTGAECRRPGGSHRKHILQRKWRDDVTQEEVKMKKRINRKRAVAESAVPSRGNQPPVSGSLLFCKVWTLFYCRTEWSRKASLMWKKDFFWSLNTEALRGSI